MVYFLKFWDIAFKKILTIHYVIVKWRNCWLSD